MLYETQVCINLVCVQGKDILIINQEAEMTPVEAEVCFDVRYIIQDVYLNC